MNANDAELWGGIAAILLSVGLLFSPYVFDLAYTSPLFVAGVAGLAVGSVLVGLSQRGRAA